MIDVRQVALSEVFRTYLEERAEKLGREEVARRIGCGLSMLDHMRKGRRGIDPDALELTFRGEAEDWQISDLLRDLVGLATKLEMQRTPSSRAVRPAPEKPQLRGAQARKELISGELPARADAARKRREVKAPPAPPPSPALPPRRPGSRRHGRT
jgi:hypothetical protein